MTTNVDMLKPDIITRRILEEEVCQSSSAFLSMIIKLSELVRFEGECNYCKKIGHMSKDCRKRKKDKADRKITKNAIVTIAEQSMPIYTYSLSDSQQWIIDSGCLDHMSNDLSNFKNYTLLSNLQPITLGDSKTTISYHRTGTVRGWTYVNN
jgi:hypothetical protein